MRKHKKVIILSLFIFSITCAVGFWYFDICQFAAGIKVNILKREKFLKEKGVRLDSLGHVKYEDYLRIVDSLSLPKDSIPLDD